MHTLSLVTLCLAPLADVRLCVAFDRARTPVARSRCLAEMSRRGGPVVVSFLTRKHDEPTADRRPDRDRRSDSTVELLTALRRAQGKPDPLPVVARVPAEAESIFPNLPVIDAALVNRDALETPVTFQDGGDYRSGRQDRWRFDVRDARGKAMPVKQHRGFVEGGGLSGMGVLKHEESWDTTLPMRNFIDLPPGDYTVVVEYHDEITISGFASTAGLMTCRSQPFKLHVQPRVIDVAKGDRAAVRAAVAALPDKGPVLVLDRPYTKDVHDFIRPDSAPGRLLALGWRAVPALLDALDDDLTPQRRGWVLAVLYSLTGWHDPRHGSGILAEYDSRGGGWVVSGGRNGKTHALGLGSSGSGYGSATGGKFDPAAQKERAREWKGFGEYIVVREKP